MVKKFYIFSCAALVAYLCLFPQDARAGGDPKFSGRAFLEISGVQKAQRATITKKAKRKAKKGQQGGISSPGDFTVYEMMGGNLVD